MTHLSDPKVPLSYMVESLEAIREYCRGGKQEFCDSRLIRDAVIRNLEIVGEAAKQIDLPLREKYSDRGAVLPGCGTFWGYTIEIGELQGVFTDADDLDEALAMVREVVELYLVEWFKHHG